MLAYSYPDANWKPSRDCTGRPVPGWNVHVLEEKGGAADQDSASYVVKIAFFT